MPGLRTPSGCARPHSHAVLRSDDCARTSSRLRLSALNLEPVLPINPAHDHDHDIDTEAIINTESEITVTSRNVEIVLYREQVTERLGHLERYNSGVTRYEVELDHEPNPRQSKTSHRVTITGRGTGRTLHAEACGTDIRAALDGAVGKLEEQLRRRRDRRRVRHNRAHRPVIEPGRASTLHAVSDDTPRSLEHGSTLSAPGAALLSSGDARAEAASSSAPPVVEPSEPSARVPVADGAGFRSARDSNSGHPES
jgi:ribosomal subunit interface protein